MQLFADLRASLNGQNGRSDSRFTLERLNASSLQRSIFYAYECSWH